MANDMLNHNPISLNGLRKKCFANNSLEKSMVDIKIVEKWKKTECFFFFLKQETEE